MKTRLLRTVLALTLILGAVVPASAADALKDLVKILDLREAKKNAEVAFACESYLNDHPKSAADATVRFYLAKALYDQKEHKDAIEAVNELLVKHPKTDMLEAAVMMRGEARRLTSKWADAIPDFRRAEELAARYKGANAAHALYHVIQGLNILKKQDEAEKQLARLKKEYPKSTYVRTATSLLARNKKAAAAPKKV
ncbi:MAG: tetratricopeptide repeat protein, partial [Limisphaerales bacterium]